MATNQLRRVLQTLSRADLYHEVAGRTDGQLLESYVRSREEAAFAALVRRHGPMVWAVCRRVLRGHQDAEDAFQATFLVLVRKAAAVVPREMVANWLYGVAHQTALKARATTAKRQAREKQVTAMPEAAAEQQDLWHNLEPLLDQELSRLPDKYRAVLVLCDLQGKTRKEAARHFRLPEGTVASRLATARTMLAKRLARCGVTVPGGAVAAVLAQEGASAGVPTSVVSSTIQAANLFAAGQAAASGALSAEAVALADGVLKTMLLSKLKIATVAVLVAVAVLGAGAAALTQQAPAEKPADLTSRERERSDVPADPPPKENKQGEPGTTAVSGVVKAVDVAKSTVTVSQREGEKTFPVANDATMVINGRPGNLAGLPKGALASLTLSGDAPAARTIEAVGPYLGGVVTAVDAEKRALTITVAQGGGERTFTLTKNANVVIDGKPGQLAALPPGANVTLSWFADLKTARTLEATGSWWQSIRVKAVDAAKGTITFDENERVLEVAGKTLLVAKDASIMIDGKPGKLAALPPGAFVTLYLCADQKTIHGFNAEGRGFQGVLVKAVDADKGTITFEDYGNDREGLISGKTLPVAKDANIVIDGKPAKPGQLAGIPVGAVVNPTLSVDQKTVRGLSAEGRAFFDVPVKAVDAEKGTITFGDYGLDKQGLISGRTLPVVKNARIGIDFRQGQLAALPTGAYANVGLSVDQKAVLSLDAIGVSHQNVPVKAVDAAKHTITIGDEQAPAEMAGKTIPVAKNANVEIDYQPGHKLSDLPPGVLVNFTFSADQKTVLMLSAVGSQIGNTNNVVVVAVDAGKNAITVDIPEDGEKTFTVAKDATIEVDAKPGTLAMVPRDAFVVLTLSADRKTVRSVQAKGLQTNGVLVKAVDPGNSTITFAAEGAPAEVAGKTFPVAKDADIRIDNKPGKLAGVPPGASVWLGLSVDQKTIIVIQAEGAQLGNQGGVVVQAVDAEKGTITVDINGEGEKTFPVAKDADIRIDNKPGKLAALPKEGPVVLTLSADQKTVRAIQTKPQ
jgi:RNA polymerase sigma factor (sigma-70 family)